MRRILEGFLGAVALAATLLVAGTTQAGQQEEREAFDRKVLAELRERDPAAAELLVQADRARDTQQHEKAAELYGQIFEKAPWFIHAERRRCSQLEALGRRDEALPLCRDAVEKDASAPNLAALASVIISRPKGTDASQADLEEAAALLDRAEQADPNESYVAVEQCQIALQTSNLGRLRDCQSRLEHLAPEEPATAFFGWVRAMSEGKFGDADDFIALARKNHAPAAMIAQMEQGTEEARPWTNIAWSYGWKLLLGWALLSGVLVLGGMVLSYLTLRNTEKWTAESARRGAALRTVYRGVLVVCSALYYASLPLVLLLVVAFAGGLVWGMFAIGYIPIKLGLIAILMVIATASALIKSLLFRPSDEDPGITLDLSEEPELRALLHEVAAQIGTSPVDKVYLTPSTNMAVFERKRGERCLVLGVGLLEGMPLPAFKAILAHEYGHFSNRDTAGGGFALGVRRSLLLFVIGLAQSGHAAPWNPAWLFANGFYRIFLRISQGASRLQEILADRRAAEAYGGSAFATGMRHVVACSLSFEDHVNGEIERALKAKEPLTRLWSPLAERGSDEKALADALNREPSPYDSHPSPADRIRWVEGIAGAVESGDASNKQAWDLFRDRAAVERRVTLEVYERLAESGVRPVPLPKLPQPT